MKWIKSKKGSVMSFDKKDDFRKLSLKKLKFLSKKIKKDKDICKNILKVIDFYKPKKLLLYVPLKNEVNIQPLINKLRKRKNIKIYVPLMVDKSFVPVLYRLPLQTKRFGIKEPKSCVNKGVDLDLDMVVVPIIGIDKTYRRIGFGAGMYDRFYAKLKHKPITIFTQLKLCITNKTLTNDYDISADFIITK
jgi:5-formyltetrahydrofolate cyclo-ligase